MCLLTLGVSSVIGASEKNFLLQQKTKVQVLMTSRDSNHLSTTGLNLGLHAGMSRHQALISYHLLTVSKHLPTITISPILARPILRRKSGSGSVKLLSFCLYEQTLSLEGGHPPYRTILEERTFPCV